MRNHALRRLTPYVKPYLPALILAVVLAFGEIGAESSIPLLTRRVIDVAIKKGHPNMLLPLVGLILFLGGFEMFLAFQRRRVASRAVLQLETDLRDELYAHLQRLHVSFHDSWQSGQLLSRAINDINSIRRFVGFGAPFLIIVTVQFFVIVGLMFKLDVALATVCAVGILPVGWISHYFGKSYRVIARQVQDQQGDLGTIIEESATGIRIVKAFGRRPEMLTKFRTQAVKLQGTNMKWVRLISRIWPTFDAPANILTGVILVVGGSAVIGHKLTLGTLVAFISYLAMLVWPVDALGWILAMMEESRTATERLFEVLDTVPGVADLPGAHELVDCTGRITIKGVSFRYDEHRDQVLKDVNLEIRPGETLALVGKTGCGKSTLAMLIPRLYDVNHGGVMIDGVDVRNIKLSSLRSHVGVAFEDPILFSASVRENLLMGRPDASDDEVKEALETAQADFVHELPFGLDTRVGEQGHTLSGGQRQRLALARAVLGRPQILVLDDPLSSVDVHTEEMIERALASVLDGVTAVVVVHRPSTLSLADRVALLDEGSIVAVGTHHELMESVPMYRAILSQEAEEIDKQAEEMSV
ncbi:MAG: ABC transporter ATP-binding protein [Actinomycetota bacterium]